MTIPYTFNQWVRITDGGWKGETGFVKATSEEKNMVQVELTSDGECLWFYTHKVEKFIPSN